MRGVVKEFKESHTAQYKSEKKIQRDWKERKKVFSGQMRPSWSYRGHRDVAHVWRKKGEAQNPKKTVPTVGGGRVKLWGCLRAFETGNLVEVEIIMK